MKTPYRRNTPILDKLIERYQVKDSCWEWTAAKDTCGYGRVWYQGKNCTAHTVAYSVFVGEIPQGKHVLHSCDNQSCINPEHLSLGDHQENMRHKSIRGRVSGERNPMSKKRRSLRKLNSLDT